MRSRQSGFTLVEIAIVLVIIGLLLGGVLKGQELITSAKIKNLANDFNGISTAVYAYQDRYRALPGDDAGATRWPQITSAGTGLGDGNGLLGTGATRDAFNAAYAATAAPETILFWTELRLSGLVSGNITEGQPVNAVGGILGVQSGAGNPTAGATQGLGGLVACQTNVLGKLAEAMDRQLDDGKPDGGSVKAWVQTTATTAATITVLAANVPSTTYVDDGVTAYTICKQIL